MRSRAFTAPMLVHTSSSRVSIPICVSLFRREVVDSLLVLLQKRKGNGDDDARRRRIASGELAMGSVAVWMMVPEISMSNALMAGRWVMVSSGATKREGGVERSTARSVLSLT